MLDIDIAITIEDDNDTSPPSLARSGPEPGGSWRSILHHLAELGLTGHLLPAGRIRHLGGDPAVLVDSILLDPAVLPGEPHHLGQLAVPLRQLEIEEEVGAGEVVAGDLVPARQHARGQAVPGGGGLPVGDSDNVGCVGGQGWDKLVYLLMNSSHISLASRESKTSFTTSS